MGRLPNYRFSVARKREITPLEAKIDAAKQHFTHAFTKTRGGQRFPRGSLSIPSSCMGKNNKKRGGDIDWEAMAGDDGHESGQIGHSNENSRSRGGTDNGNGRSSPDSDRYNGRNSKDQGMSQAQTEVDFDPYLEVVKELKTHLVGSQKVLKKSYDFYKKQEQEIKEAVQTKQQLEQMTEENKDLRTTISILQNFGKEKDKMYELKVQVLRMKDSNYRGRRKKPRRTKRN